MSVCTTVVGGRAPNNDRDYIIPISGIEQALKAAAGDLVFRENLFEYRSNAVRELGIDLTPLDAEIINEVPESQLRCLIRAIITRYRRAPLQQS